LSPGPSASSALPDHIPSRRLETGHGGDAHRAIWKQQATLAGEIISLREGRDLLGP
jgi:hypothetical protein